MLNYLEELLREKTKEKKEEVLYKQFVEDRKSVIDKINKRKQKLDQ